MPDDIPTSMEDLLYFSNRKMPDGVRIIAWVDKLTCEKCKKALMGKPINEKTGKVKIRAAVFVCPECEHEEPKTAHTKKLVMQIRYTDETGKNWKSAQTAYTLKTWKGMKAYVFQNEFTGEKMGVTKRLKMKGDPDEK